MFVKTSLIKIKPLLYNVTAIDVLMENKHALSFNLKEDGMLFKYDTSFVSFSNVCNVFNIILLASFMVSKNKRAMMVVGGYRYSLHYSRNNRERWMCSRRSYYGCKAVIHTYLGKYRYSNTEHNHPKSRC